MAIFNSYVSLPEGIYYVNMMICVSRIQDSGAEEETPHLVECRLLAVKRFIHVHTHNHGLLPALCKCVDSGSTQQFLSVFEALSRQCLARACWTVASSWDLVRSVRSVWVPARVLPCSAVWTWCYTVTISYSHGLLWQRQGLGKDLETAAQERVESV